MADSVQTVLEEFSQVRIDHDNLPFYEGLLRHEYLINHCAECGFWHTPPRAICPKCWSKRLEPTAISGRGFIHTLTFLYQGPPALGVDYSQPYPLAAIELPEQENLRIVGTIVNCPPEMMKIGMDVEMVWLDRSRGLYPAFQPRNA